jgi:hypothetical protein
MNVLGFISTTWFESHIIVMCKVREMQNATHSIVSEVKNFFTTVFSVFQNLEKPTWLSKKKK